MKMAIRVGIVINFFKQINFECLEPEKAGNNIQEIFRDLTSSLTPRANDKKTYDNSLIGFVAKLLGIGKLSLSQILGSCIRAIEAIMRLQRQENFNFAIAQYFSDLLLILRIVIDFLMGSLDDSIGMSPKPYAGGITHAMLTATDGQPDDRNVQYEKDSIIFLCEETTRRSILSQQVNKTLPGSFNAENVPTDPALVADNAVKEKINAYRQDVDAHAAAVRESLHETAANIPAQNAIRLLKTYGTKKDIEVQIPSENASEMPLPDEVQEFIKTHSSIEMALGLRKSGMAQKTILDQGTAIPENFSPEESTWLNIIVGYEEAYESVKKIFKSVPDGSGEFENLTVSVFFQWTIMRIEYQGVIYEVALPTAYVVDDNGDTWIALFGIKDGCAVRMSEWTKYDATSPEETATAICMMAGEKSCLELREEEEKLRGSLRQKRASFEENVARKKASLRSG
jgi:hypothetical protein